MTFWRDRRVPVGGGCGPIGSCLVPALAAVCARVRVVDILEHGDRATLDPLAGAMS